MENLNENLAYVKNWNIALKYFANKAAFPSHLFKSTKSSLPEKLAQNICNKNGSSCNRGSHFGFFL